MSTLTDRIEQTLGLRIASTGRLGAGFGLTGLRLDMADGTRLAVKAGQGPRPGHLALEGWMLAELRERSALPVPEPVLVEDDLLVMTWIDNDGGGISHSAERHAAELLAELHALRFDAFGYGRDTVIGPLHQPNPPASEWVPFFRDHRLLHMARAAHEEGALPARLLARIEKLAGRIGDYIFEPPHPSLIHGDLWTGNVLTKGERIAGFVDPAIYFAHPEIELAFTTMFGTFGRAFFDAYAALGTLDEGFFDLRRDIYNLYPTLVHVRLFGAGYLSGVESTLRKAGH